MSNEGLTWDLLAIVSLPKSECIECRCKNCPKTIYAQVHIIGWSDGRIEPWGSGCYMRELGHTARGRDMQPRYPGEWGPSMLPEMRQLIGTRTDLFIAQLEKLRAGREEAERKARAAAEEAERQRVRRAEEARRTREAQEQLERAARAKAQEAKRLADLANLEAYNEADEERRRSSSVSAEPEFVAPEEPHPDGYSQSSFDANGEQSNLPCELCGKRTRQWWMTEMTSEGRKCRCKACASAGRWR